MACFVFPGQGMQQPGMLSDVIERYDIVQVKLQEFSELCGHDMIALHKEGSEENLTDATLSGFVVASGNIAIYTLLKNHGIQYSHASKLSEEEIQAEYAAADMLLFCSTLEGYGMPIIEAQTVGIPVVTSLRAPMDKTAGGGALLADPEDITAIKEAVEQVLGHPEVRQQVLQKGRANAADCSAAASAQKHADLYAELIGKSR